MADVSQARVINIPHYLTALSQLPEVTQQEVEKVRTTLLPFADNGGNISFLRGIEGDGKISFLQKVEAVPGSKRWITTSTYLDDRGFLENPETNFRERFSLPFSAYFFAGIFGIDEMNVHRRQRATMKNWGLNPFLPTIVRVDPWGVHERTKTSFPHIDLHFERLVAGLSQLYASFEKTGDIETAVRQKALHFVEGAKAVSLEAKPLFVALETDEERLLNLTSEYETLVASIPLATQMKLKEEATLQTSTLPITSNDDIRRRHAIMRQRIESLQAAITEGRALVQRVTKEVADERERNALIQKTSTLWQSAEAMYRASIGPGGGDSDVIRRIIDSYKPLRSYTSPSTRKEVEQAYAAAEAMLRELGNDDDGWEQFKKYYCSQGRFVSRHACDEGSWSEYLLDCRFGVSNRGETTSSDDGCKNRPPKEPNYR